MNNVEKNAVKIVAKLAPWLAPFPSAYFVARSAMVHLALPLPVAVVVAAIIETLGLATVHTALWAYDWNAHKRKTDPDAPVGLAIVLGAVYVAATLGLVVFLEVWPVSGTVRASPLSSPCRGRGTQPGHDLPPRAAGDGCQSRESRASSCTSSTTSNCTSDSRRPEHQVSCQTPLS